MSLSKLLDRESLEKLQALDNKKVLDYVEDYVKLCKPASVKVITDSKEDIQYVRELAIKNGEESKLTMEGHTIHFDGVKDQGRDKLNTRYLVSEDVDWGLDVNTIDKSEGVDEVRSFLDGSMKGKVALVVFFSLGPINSPFSLRAMQITDSAYVVHSETILYRGGYEEFKRLKGSDDFFFIIHSAGELENGVSKNVDKRRMYMDLEDNIVYSVNNQYAGNSVGLKKLSFRLAIQKANNEDWLSEHMFIMGVHGKPGRITYFAGAFPSACGKTSTAMIPGQTIVGDDIAYIRKFKGEVRAVNVENGIFGIIEDVNPTDDPLIYDALTTPREVIFSNILVNDGEPYWLGMGMDPPEEGINYAGKWKKGMKDSEGREIRHAHKNARYTIRINELANADDRLQDPNGVNIKAIVYGGRDSDTTVPIAESLAWSHGVMMGATVESETTAATIGKQGVRQHDPMANLDFISVPIGKYLSNHLEFVKDLDKEPTIYATNYFIKDENGDYLNDKVDKKVWILWADGRVNGEYEAIKTPIGKIPKYEDLKELFKKYLDKEYAKEDYIKQFSIRAKKYLEKMERMLKFYKSVDVPEELVSEIKEQTKRLEAAREKYSDTISPEKFI